jgi:6-hydroxytryprostatin B O-methyltransferase
MSSPQTNTPSNGVLSNGISSNGVSSNGVSDKQPLVHLASAISENANIVSGYLVTNSLPQPSFEAGGPSVIVPVSAPPNVQLARQKLLAASLEIFQLATGPSEFLPNLATGVSAFNIVQPFIL